MKVLAVNASPHRERGNTALILTPFLTGMKEAGVDAETRYAEDLTIRPCQGNFACFCRPSSTCVQRSRIWTG